MGQAPKPTKRIALIAARVAAGFTQETLAARVGVERTTVYRWESGDTSPLPMLRPGLARLLGLTNGELALALGEARHIATVPVQPPGGDKLRAEAPTNEEWQRGTAVDPVGSPAPSSVPSGLSSSTKDLAAISRALDDLAAAVATVLALLVTTTSGAAIPGDEAGARLADLDRLVEEMKRRGLMQTVLKLATGSTLTAPTLGGLRLALNLDPDEQERVAKVIVSPERVDERVIGHIETMLWMCKRQDDTFGPRGVLNAVLDQQYLVQEVLLPACPDHLLPRMLSLYSSLCLSAGWYYFDLNDFERAWYQLERARESAHKARNTELSIYTLCNMSYAASWHDQVHAGVDLATVAQALAVKTGDMLLRVCVADVTALSYAADENYGECMKELSRAQATLSASAGQVPPGSLAYYHNDGFLANHKGDYLLRLGKHQEAVASARAGLALYDKSFTRDFAFCALHLGKALVQSKEIDEAASSIGEAAKFTTQNRSARLIKELRATRTAMQPWRATKAVRELDEQLVGLGLEFVSQPFS